MWDCVACRRENLENFEILSCMTFRAMSVNYAQTLREIGANTAD